MVAATGLLMISFPFKDSSRKLLLHFCQGALGGGDLPGDLLRSGATEYISPLDRAFGGNCDTAQL